jgi:glutamate-1-semialdehyde 2,1-aminomutase
MQKRRPRSKEIYDAASKVIPGGVNSPVRAFKGLNDPLIVERAKGSVLVDADGNEYIDYCCGWGALLHGHNPDFLVQAMKRQFEKGLSFGISTQIEGEIAELIVNALPSMEMIRFVSSGTEAVMSAIRLARGVTGRPAIVKFEGHYHGHSDSLLVKAGSSVAELPQASSQGVPSDIIKHTLCLPFNDFESCRNVLRTRRDIAGVILEPVTANMGVVLPEDGFLEMLREETRRAGALLIFDEVVTGFRLGFTCAQGLFGIDPDLTCLGKIIGGGFPAAAFGGKREFMQHMAPLGNVYQAGTLSGFPVAMAAGIAALQELQKPGFFEHLEAMTKRLVDPIKQYVKKHSLPVFVNSCGSMMTLFFGVESVKSYSDLKNLDKEIFKAFFAHMLDRGIYLPPSQYEAWFVSSAHAPEQIDYTRDAILAILENFDEVKLRFCLHQLQNSS